MASIFSLMASNERVPVIVSTGTPAFSIRRNAKEGRANSLAIISVGLTERIPSGLSMRI